MPTEGSCSSAASPQTAAPRGGAAAHRGAPLSDLWQWDGTRWTEIRPAGTGPGHRYQPVMVYDRRRDRTVLYGGIGSSSASSSDTWEWDGAVWRAMAASH